MHEYSDAQLAAQGLSERLVAFVQPLLVRLDEKLDKRLVRTCLGLLQVMVLLRHNRYGLLLSELGGYLLGPAHAPAGTKRISNLLRSERWSHQVVDDHLWQQADRHVQQLVESQATALVLWDESVIEKPESLASEGLCAVRSAKAHRLKRIKRGFYNPPTLKPIFVPGYHWLAVMVLGLAGVPTLAALRFWTRRGEFATDRLSVACALLAQSVQAWGRQVVHVFDRGYAGAPWLTQLVQAQVRFIVRWRSDYHLQDDKGKRAPGAMCRGRRSLDHRLLRDSRHRCERRVGLLYFPVRHPQLPDYPLWLVVARPKGHAAWHFLTNEPITSSEEAWAVVYAYARRWQIECAFRFLKTELAMESPRLWFWENKRKLFALVALVYAFLLSLLAPAAEALRTHLLTHWCPRTGERPRQATLPLYPLRSALVRLGLAHPLNPVPHWSNTG
jgi:hypothetical protein